MSRDRCRLGPWSRAHGSRLSGADGGGGGRASGWEKVGARSRGANGSGGHPCIRGSGRCLGGIDAGLGLGPDAWVAAPAAGSTRAWARTRRSGQGSRGANGCGWRASYQRVEARPRGIEEASALGAGRSGRWSSRRGSTAARLGPGRPDGGGLSGGGCGGLGLDPRAVAGSRAGTDAVAGSEGGGCVADLRAGERCLAGRESRRSGLGSSGGSEAGAGAGRESSRRGCGRRGGDRGRVPGRDPGMGLGAAAGVKVIRGRELGLGGGGWFGGGWLAR